jgi:hypothetical protein
MAMWMEIRLILWIPKDWRLNTRKMLAQALSKNTKKVKPEKQGIQVERKPIIGAALQVSVLLASRGRGLALFQEFHHFYVLCAIL